jgi:nitroreductase
MNGQPWHFVVVRSPEIRSRLAEIKNDFCPPAKRTFRADFIARAPLVIVVCVEEENSYDRALENGIIAATHILLAARDLELGAVYMSAYASEEPGLAQAIAELLHLPAGVAPVTLIPMGYPAETPAARDMRPLDRMVHRERF